jgi:hypothetical protein
MHQYLKKATASLFRICHGKKDDIPISGGNCKDKCEIFTKPYDHVLILYIYTSRNKSILMHRRMKGK